MSAAKVTFLRPVVKLIPPQIPDSDFSRLMAEGFALAKANPHILEAIDRDRDVVAIEKKQERLIDQEWLRLRGLRLPGFEVGPSINWAVGLELGIGRERMPAIMVLVFILIRGYKGGFKDRKMVSDLADSRTLEIILNSFGLSMPGASTILDNINSVTPATLELILDAQIALVLFEELDDLKKLTFDSTSVKGNTAFPTDSGTILGLARRVEHLLRSVSKHGITLKLPAIMSDLLASIAELHKKIQFSVGKKNSAKLRAKLYRKLLKIARQVRQALTKAQHRAAEKLTNLDLLPSRGRIVTKIVEWAGADLQDLGLAIVNADKRINQDKKVPNELKIVSLSDSDAAMIVKGQRDIKVGYKPQIGRSEKGFVTAIIVPEGNAADSGQLRPIVGQAMKRSGVLPDVLSLDDGYTNTNDRDYFLGLGIDVVSFSGSKGRNIIPTEDYDSKPYQQARNDRSAVESLMFTLKHNHDMDQVMRRGIENVRSELLEKVIAYNFFRLIKLRHDVTARKAAA